ncbi:Mediator of replication checkpoint 1, partial [Fusarium albosuccineum]
MATTPPRALSPASSGGSPEPLTIKSKLEAALLAASDDSGDEDSPLPTTTKNKSPRRIPNIDLPQSSSDDESEEEVRPRGRFASRMQGITRATETATSNNEATREKDHNIDMPDAQSQEDDTPVASRRLARRAPQSPAANATATESRAASPGLFLSSP